MKKVYSVLLEEKVKYTGRISVKASSKEQAKTLALKLANEGEVFWDEEDSQHKVISCTSK